MNRTPAIQDAAIQDAAIQDAAIQDAASSAGRSRLRPTKLLGFVVLVAVLGLAAWCLRMMPPTDQSMLPKCGLHEMTGIHCPGCGATRATHLLLNGRLLDALRCNALLIAGMPAFGLLWCGVYRYRRDSKWARHLPWILGVVVLAFFVVRNVPTPATSPFAPPTMEPRSAAIK
ncbi:MAG: DUF2752 domain-containing protein [Planctomycetota bacterium]